MSTVNERAVRRIGKQRDNRRSLAIEEDRLVIEDGSPWNFGRDWEVDPDLIVDRRKAESKTALPWWWFW